MYYADLILTLSNTIEPIASRPTIGAAFTAAPSRCFLHIGLLALLEKTTRINWWLSTGKAIRENAFVIEFQYNHRDNFAVIPNALYIGLPCSAIKVRRLSWFFLLVFSLFVPFVFASWILDEYLKREMMPVHCYTSVHSPVSQASRPPVENPYYIVWWTSPIFFYLVLNR